MRATHLQCPKCENTFRLGTPTNKALRKATCPFCGHKRVRVFFGYGLSKADYYRDEHGATQRKHPKVRMSKKQRRKVRASTV